MCNQIQDVKKAKKDAMAYFDHFIHTFKFFKDDLKGLQIAANMDSNEGIHVTLWSNDRHILCRIHWNRGSTLQRYTPPTPRNDTDAEMIRYHEPIYDEEPNWLRTDNDTLLANIAELKAQIQKRFIAIAAFLKMTLGRNSSKNMSRFSSNDMVHNHYLDEAKKKIQERDRNSTTSVTTSARIQTTADDSKPKPRSNNQTSKSLLSLRVVWWIPTGKLFDSCTSKVDSELTHGLNVDILNIHECKQTLDVSAESMVAEKADISETIVKVDSEMMIQN
ncbi:hypothetical protein Tco_0168480 [Tanacetum coccineum]